MGDDKEPGVWQGLEGQSRLPPELGFSKMAQWVREGLTDRSCLTLLRMLGPWPALSSVSLSVCLSEAF